MDPMRRLRQARLTGEDFEISEVASGRRHCLGAHVVNYMTLGAIPTTSPSWLMRPEGYWRNRLRISPRTSRAYA